MCFCVTCPGKCLYVNVCVTTCVKCVCVWVGALVRVWADTLVFCRLRRNEDKRSYSLFLAVIHLLRDTFNYSVFFSHFPLASPHSSSKSIPIPCLIFFFQSTPSCLVQASYFPCFSLSHHLILLFFQSIYSSSSSTSSFLLHLLLLLLTNFPRAAASED